MFALHQVTGFLIITVVKLSYSSGASVAQILASASELGACQVAIGSRNGVSPRTIFQ